ncbi:Hypothetical predicted protein [Pelobates cultripes]|uniref:L1 transposable element RRM domain-containing protein n=1 Tax=Pelobates cultripes TaxID=61616 RepID=A0AAD1R6M5_PELCU|nr:Hypothetical predicted protein [Pelobates cultripes]
MRRKSKKYRTEKHPTTADTGELLWRQQVSLRLVMVPLSDAPSRSSSEDSLSNLEMMAETQRAEEIHGVSVRLHDTEISTAAHEVRINSLESELTKTKNDLIQTQHHVAAMEDHRRWNNVKIRGLAESVTTAEIHHLIRRVLSRLFMPKQAKARLLEGCYRLPQPQANSQQTSRDVIVRFQHSPDKQAFLSAVRITTPYQFEGHSLLFYPDISRATMTWWRSMRPPTTVRMQHSRWGAP